MSIVLLGSTSGSCTLQEQAVAGTTTLTLPTFNGTVGLLVSGTAVTSTSGTSIDFTGIPAGVRRITVMLSNVSTNGTSIPQIQIGDSGGIEATGYIGAAFYGITSASASTQNSTGFLLSGVANAAAYTYSGIYTISLLNAASNIWSFSGSSSSSDAARIFIGSGSKTLSDVLDRVRITTVNGTDTFDAGSINILYE